VGILGNRTLNSYPESIINNGMIQINYIIENLPKGSSVIMNVYAFTKNVKEGNFTEATPGIYWTNDVSKTLFSVSGIKEPDNKNKNNTTSTNTTSPNNPVNGIWTINSKMSNSEIKNILNKAKNGNTILFTSGNYKKLELSITKSLKIKTSGKVLVTGTGRETLFKIKSSKVSITGFNINKYKKGILNYGTKNTIYENNIQSSKSIAIQNKGKSANIAKNNITSNKYGIYNTGHNTKINQNNVKKNKEYGIYNKAKYTTITKNIVTNNKKGIYYTKKTNQVKNNKVQNNKKNILKK
jgi:parallel beta-helix repeat protein